MRASELLGRAVVDGRGEELGLVHDVRVAVPDGDLPARHPDAPPPPHEVPIVVSLVVGPGTRRCRLAFAWGYGQDRTRGPLLFAAVLGGAWRAACEVPVDDVVAWDDGGRIQVRERGR
ncbi:PRC-barrel domain-containing protein [Nocardioides sp. SYSU DS0651]|uniref:PRC-barrel domain-containing protein n=1 Tax=Nocardioides sp. SYSU DS0651 TaxID=3415955 RepID=UPI003F4C8B5A